MAFRVEGDNVSIPGQASVSGSPTSLLHVTRNLDVSRRRAFVANIALDAAAPIDLAPILVPSSDYIPTAIWACHPNGNVSGASIGIYTAAGGGGTAVVAPAALATLTAVGEFQLLTLAALTSALSGALLYPRLTVAAGAGAVCSLMVEFVDISLI